MESTRFVDIVSITAKAGNGGNGIVSFKNFKGKPACGPDGGNGGNGGSVFLRADRNTPDLLPFRFSPKFFAPNGANGGPNRQTGKNGQNLVINVPCGTIARDPISHKILCDLFRDGDQYLLLSGGAGGKGNANFASSRRHAPDFSQSGVITTPHTVTLELKLIADVGFVGFPNAGKSSLLTRISAAKPKIADYPFTTLSPNLGVVPCYDSSFVAADIPGLIRGAASGAGLGHDFLRHIERTRLLVHVLDISASENRDPLDDFLQINSELSAYSPNLSSLPMLVACNKIDCPSATENLERFRLKFGSRFPVFPISALTGEGVPALVHACGDLLVTLPPPQPIPADDFSLDDRPDLSCNISRTPDGAFLLSGSLIDMLCRNVLLNNPDSMAYFQRVLKLHGVFKNLAALGCKEGDTVIVGNTEFEFVP